MDANRRTSMTSNGEKGNEAEWQRPKRVLVAEDDPDMRVLIAETLRSSGFEVAEAASGSELFALIEAMTDTSAADGLDLIVSDIRMPAWSGLDVLAALRDAGSTVPVVLITAFGSLATHEQARHLGALLVIDKPFDLEELEEAVGTILKSPRQPHSSLRYRRHRS